MSRVNHGRSEKKSERKGGGGGRGDKKIPKQIRIFVLGQRKKRGNERVRPSSGGGEDHAAKKHDCQRREGTKPEQHHSRANKQTKRREKWDLVQWQR